MSLKFLVSSEAGAGIKGFLWSLCNISQYITMNHNACGNQFELILKGNVSCLELREEQLQLVIVSGMDNFVRIQPRFLQSKSPRYSPWTLCSNC